MILHSGGNFSSLTYFGWVFEGGGNSPVFLFKKSQHFSKSRMNCFFLFVVLSIHRHVMTCPIFAYHLEGVLVSCRETSYTWTSWEHGWCWIYCHSAKEFSLTYKAEPIQLCNSCLWHMEGKWLIIGWVAECTVPCGMPRISRNPNPEDSEVRQGGGFRYSGTLHGAVCVSKELFPHLWLLAYLLRRSFFNYCGENA